MWYTLLLALAAAATWQFPPAELSPGELDEREFKRGHEAVMWTKFEDRLELLKPTQENPARFRVAYPAGGWGTNDSGAQFMLELKPQPVVSAQYAVRFAPDFTFVKGGKLPGLAGGTATAGKDRPTGDGWSARLMWRDGGEAVLYLYHLDQEKDYADDIPLGRHFEPGQWQLITQEVRVNDAGKANGRIRIWWNRQLVLDRGELRLRTGDQAPVDRFYFSTFFGGSGDEWAPATTQHAEFSAIKLSTPTAR